MNDTEHYPRRKVLVIALLGLFIGLLAYAVADQALNQQIAFDIITNNTDLCAFNHTSGRCDGTRNGSTDYYNNDSAIQILLKAHANAVAQNASIQLYINDTEVLHTSGRPLGVAEDNYKSISVLIPKGQKYKAIFLNYHHYEWREYQILSGKNGTLSIVQNITQTGGGGVSFDGTPVNLNGSRFDNGTQYFINNTQTAYYVEKNGSDSNTCLSISSACLTVMGAINKIPAIVTNNVQVYINGTYTENVILQGKSFSGPYTITLNGTLSMTPWLNTTMTSGFNGSAYLQPVIYGTFTSGLYNNTLIKFINGSNAGEYRIVDYNNATAMVLTGNILPGAFSAGDNFKILNWTAVINPPSDYSIRVISQNGIIIDGIYLDGGFTMDGSTDEILHSKIKTKYQPSSSIDVYSHVKQSTLKPTNNLWTVYSGNYVMLDIRMSDTQWMGNKIFLEPFDGSAGVIGILSRVGYTLIWGGNVFDSAVAGSVRVDNNGHVQFNSQTGIQNNFMRLTPGGIGVVVLDGSGAMGVTTAINATLGGGTLVTNESSSYSWYN